MNGEKLQREEKRMLINTQSRDDIERIPKRPFPESVNRVWIFLFDFWGKGILKHFPPEPGPGKGHFSPLRSGSPPGVVDSALFRGIPAAQGLNPGAPSRREAKG